VGGAAIGRALSSYPARAFPGVVASSRLGGGAFGSAWTSGGTGTADDVAIGPSSGGGRGGGGGGLDNHRHNDIFDAVVRGSDGDVIVVESPAAAPAVSSSWV
jgi:hypothetical protein